MSCNEWERGTIKIPAGAWAKFRGDLIRAWNAKQDDLFETAAKVAAQGKAAAQGKRGKNRSKAIDAAVARACGGRLDEWGDFWGSEESREGYEAVCRLILNTNGWGDNRTVTLKTPKKSDLDKKPVSKSCVIHLPGATVAFNNTTKSVTWDVPECNRACESARNHWFSKRLFSALSRIEWTRNSGGTIVGNNEYNCDSDDVGGGANYVVVEYRRLTAAEKRAAAKRAAQRRAYRYAW